MLRCLDGLTTPVILILSRQRPSVAYTFAQEAAL
jgi:hypothetical protein